MDRTASQQTQIYETFAWAYIEVLNNFICGGVLLCIQVIQWCSLYIGNYSKLQ